MRTFAVGDVHGDVVRLRELLSAAGLIDGGGAWSGGDARLVFTGDLTDRGHHGIETIQLVRRLQREAAERGGFVESLMGNHDALILARAYERRGEPANPDCLYLFVANGGFEPEARAIAEDEALFEWIRARPAMLMLGRTLFQHADSALVYQAYAPSGEVDVANAKARELAATGPGAYRLFYEITGGRYWDADARRFRNDRELIRHLRRYLELFGAERVVHGHTAHFENRPRVYADGLAVNVDGGMSNGYRHDPDRGFVAEL